MTDQQFATGLFVYVGSVIFGTLYGNSRGSAQLGFLWPFVFGPIGLILVWLSTGKKDLLTPKPTLQDQPQQQP